MNQTICVCGAGTMGSGIAQVSAQSGFQNYFIRSQSCCAGKGGNEYRKKPAVIG